MMKRTWLAIWIAFLLPLTGCWDRSELPDKGFVMGVAMDSAENGEIKLTTQVFKPSQGIVTGGKQAQTSYLNVETRNPTVSRAVRDIPINLGRKAQWSHIRVIIISEKLARERSISELLGFFYRDHEARLTVTLIISEGEAAQYLEQKPMIENTVSQQLFESEKAAAESNEKTSHTNLLKLGLQMKSQVGNAFVPYLYLSQNKETVTNVAGIAMLRKGKFEGKMPAKISEGLHMLIDQYKSGMYNVPCLQAEPGEKPEVVEILSFKTKLKPVIRGDSLTVRVHIDMELAIMELSCTKLKSVKDEDAFEKRVAATVKQEVETTADWLQEKKYDALGLGDAIYRKNPRLWKLWKPDWDERFARCRFVVEVEARVNNSGTSIAQPIFNH